MKDLREEAADKIVERLTEEWDKMSEMSRMMLKFGEENRITPTAFVAACFITIRSCTTPSNMPEELVQILDGFAKKVSADAFEKMKPAIEAMMEMQAKGKKLN